METIEKSVKLADFVVARVLEWVICVKKDKKTNKNCMFLLNILYKIDYKFENMIFIVNVMIVVILMDVEYAAMATMTTIIVA